MSNTFSKQVGLRFFQKGDLVLAIQAFMIIGKEKRKFEPNRNPLHHRKELFKWNISSDDCRR